MPNALHSIALPVLTMLLIASQPTRALSILVAPAALVALSATVRRVA
jgi:hypothetical protein